MDTGEGRFEIYKKLKDAEEAAEKARLSFPLAGSIFQIGEIIQIKNSKFKIKSINPKGIRLKLLKQEPK